MLNIFYIYMLKLEPARGPTFCPGLQFLEFKILTIYTNLYHRCLIFQNSICLGMPEYVFLVIVGETWCGHICSVHVLYYKLFSCYVIQLSNF